jgi:uncharacterized membrane protein
MLTWIIIAVVAVLALFGLVTFATNRGLKWPDDYRRDD